MNADAFRQLYDYHFRENRKLWDYASQLTEEQFREPAGYSRGSVCEQIIHIMECDQIWFCELSHTPPPEPLDAAAAPDRVTIRTYWDDLEQFMRGYLAELRDDMLFTTPITEPKEDSELIVWQVLFHVVNHATDHRAQVLRQLNDMGVKTSYQDFIFYVFESLYGPGVVGEG